MRRPRVRLTLRWLMIAIALLGAMMWVVAHRRRVAALRAELIGQEITTAQAEANYQNAKLTLEVAKIAVTEYVEGTFKQDEQTAEGEIALAKSDLQRAEDRLDWTERMRKKNDASQAQLISEQRALEKARFTAEQAQTKLSVLRKYTKEKQVKALSAEVESARADELAKQATLKRERAVRDQLRKAFEGLSRW